MESKSDKVLKRLKELLENTSVQAIPNIIRSDKIIVKFIWAICLAGSAIICIFLIKESVLSFFEFQVNSKIKFANEIPIIFPKITICNRNSFFTKEGREFLKEVALKNSLKITSKNMRAVKYAAYAKIIAEKKEKYFSEPYEDFIISCQFKKFPCNQNDFEFFYEGEYGSCFSFNAYKQNSTPKAIEQPGEYYGLELIIKAGNTDDDISLTNGVRVIIKSQNDLVITREGFDLASGTENIIRLRKSYVKQLPCKHFI